MGEEQLVAAAILMALAVTVAASLIELFQRAPRRRRLNWSNRSLN